MPSLPTPCPRCRKLRCTDPEHRQGAPRQRTPRRTQRPGYNSWAERKRRKREVDAFLAANTVDVNDKGQRIAVCPECGHYRGEWVADHVQPIAQGGTEDGALRVHCKVCSNQQGARLGRG